MRTLWRLLMVLALGGCAGAAAEHGPTPTHGATPRPSASLAASCLDATRRALTLEIARYEGWLAQHPAPTQAAAYEQDLAFLRDVQATLAARTPATYQGDEAWRLPPSWARSGRELPLAREVVLDEARLEGPLPALAHYRGETRSGPFYIVVGTAPGVCPLEPGRAYRLTLRLLMPQAYPFPGYYACVLAAQPWPAGEGATAPP